VPGCADIRSRASRLVVASIVLVRANNKQGEKRGGSVLISRWGFTKKNSSQSEARK
jgi:hypothetical protein